jgi:hypothetical protein
MVFVDEPRDWPVEWPPDRIAAEAGVGWAGYLEPVEPVRLAVGPAVWVDIEPRTIIEVGGLFLVEAVDEPDTWYMGQRRADGLIECWGRYGDLASALHGL